MVGVKQTTSVSAESEKRCYTTWACLSFKNSDSGNSRIAEEGKKTKNTLKLGPLEGWIRVTDSRVQNTREKCIYVR